MKRHLKHLVKFVLPDSMHLPWQFRYIRARNLLDPELLFLEHLLPRRRRFVDIGANIGLYTYYFSHRFEAVEAFEPLAEVTRKLCAWQRAHITIHNVALSDRTGHLDFFLPIHHGEPAASLASLEPKPPPYEKRKVKVRRLDDYNFEDVDLIKIDVEGHEADVLAGALHTIEASRPVLLIEIEQRHIKVPIGVIFDRILALNYSGYFLQDDHLVDLSTFSCTRDQDAFLENVTDKRYINNFIFLPHTTR